MYVIHKYYLDKELYLINFFFLLLFSFFNLNSSYSLQSLSLSLITNMLLTRISYSPLVYSGTVGGPWSRFCSFSSVAHGQTFTRVTGNVSTFICKVLSQVLVWDCPFEIWHDYRGKKIFVFLGCHKKTKGMVEMFCVREVIRTVEKNTFRQSHGWLAIEKSLFATVTLEKQTKKSLRTIQPAVNKNSVKLPRSERPKAICW